MNLYIALLCAGLSLVSISSEVSACGKRSLGRATKVKEIAVRPAIQLPAFYLRGDNKEILFFQRDEVLAKVSQCADEYRKQGLDQAADRSEFLLKELKASQSFVDYDDLYRYSLRTTDVGLEKRALAADLLSEGKASVVERDLAGPVRDPINNVQMYFQLNSLNEPVAKWFCTAAGSPILRITYYVD